MFAAFCTSNPRSRCWQNLLLSAVLTVAFNLTRPTDAVSRPLSWAPTFAGSMASVQAWPGAEPRAQGTGLALLPTGTIVAIAAKRSLNRSFGLAPANRAARRLGIYRLVRHPTYLGYFIAQAAFLLLNPTVRNLAVYACAWKMQIARILREEQWLITDPEYRAYAERARFRLVPEAF